MGKCRHKLMCHYQESKRCMQLEFNLLGNSGVSVQLASEFTFYARQNHSKGAHVLIPRILEYVMSYGRGGVRWLTN